MSKTKKKVSTKKKVKAWGFIWPTGDIQAHENRETAEKICYWTTKESSFLIPCTIIYETPKGKIWP